MEGMVFKIIRDSEFADTMKEVHNSGLCDYVAQSRIDGRTIYRLKSSSITYDRYLKIQKIVNKKIVDDNSYEIRERFVDKIRGHIELVSTMEDHMRSFYPSA